MPGLVLAQKQGDFIIGPVLGINYVTVVGNGIDSLKQQIKAYNEPYSSIAEINSSGGIYNKTGFNAGVLLDYYFLDDIALNSGMLYSQKGFVKRSSLKITIGLDSQFEETKTVKLDYIDFPFLLKYNLNNRFDISGGLLLSVLVLDKVLIEQTNIFETYDDNGNIVTIIEEKTEKENYNDLIDDERANPLLMGFQIGVSYTTKEYPLTFSLNLNKDNNFGVVAEKTKNSNVTFQFCARLNF